MFAIGSAFPWANEHRVLLSILFVLLVTFANLRGARESGTVFAIPTYGFVVSILFLVVIGLVRVPRWLSTGRRQLGPDPGRPRRRRRRSARSRS